MILFTGAGFSSLARDASGKRRVPTGAQLADELWRIEYGDEPRDGSSLQDLYAHTLRTRRAELQALLDGRLRVCGRLLPRFYEMWFAMPWRRIYTLNVDDLATAAAARFRLPRRVRALSALRDGVEDTMLCVDREQLDIIHLNGLIDDGPERITFSTVQYAGRLAQRCAFYSQLVRDFHDYPVLFVGTKLDESPLWQHLEIQGIREDVTKTPPGLLVTQHVTRARQSLLASLNIRWLAMDVRTFAEEVLAPVRDEVLEAGLAALEATRTVHPAARGPHEGLNEEREAHDEGRDAPNEACEVSDEAREVDDGAHERHEVARDARDEERAANDGAREAQEAARSSA